MRYSILLLLPALLLGAARPLHLGSHLAPPAPAGTGSVNLAPLLRATEDGQSVHNGFFDRSRQRLEVVFLSVQRDANNPNLYQVTGKDRRYRKVEDFKGTVLFASVQLGARRRLSAPETSRQQHQEGSGEMAVPGLATGTFELRETVRPGDHDAGTFRGKVAIDFLVLANQRPVLNYRSTSALTRQAGFQFEGIWTGATAKHTWPILFQNGSSVIGRALMPDFEVGDRGGEVNPRYARVGWDTYWENEEWWAEKKVAGR